MPVIYYTTLDSETVRQEAMALGVEQYIIKNSASLVRLRTALDAIHEKKTKKGFFSKLLSTVVPIPDRTPVQNKSVGSAFAKSVGSRS